jgi:outer membrane protein assembly factor BamA
MRTVLLALVLSLVPCTGRAQDLACDPGDLEIHGVHFRGNEHFSSDELENAIITTPSSWARRVLHLPLGSRRCLDTLELARDAVRLRLFYRQRGYYRTTVNTAIATPDPGSAQIDFRIHEGPPVVIDTLIVSGLDSLPPPLAGRLLRFLAPFRGGVYDKIRLQAAIDSIVVRLLNNGYAHAGEPLRDISVVDSVNRARVKLTFLPGPVAHIGRIHFEVEGNEPGRPPQIDTTTLRKLLAFQPGDLYRQRDLLRTQRDLYGLETYRHVDVEVPDSLQTNDTSLTVLVRVGEAKMKSMRVGIGWANLDCARTQARFTDRDFLGSARRLELSGRLSHIALCPGSLQDDPFSSRLNYFTSATLRLPALLGLRNIPTLTLLSERISEYRTYIRYTPIGGAVQVTRDFRPRDLRPGLPVTLAYSLEYGRTEADPAVFCQVFNRCTLSDIDRLQRNNGLGIVSLAIARDRTDNLLNPSRGSQARLELRSGSTSVDTGLTTPGVVSKRFNRVLAELSYYQPLDRRGRSVLAMRVQAGTVLEGWSLEGATSFVPPQERLYAGGPNSVRGYNQNLLGPVVYILDSAAVTDTVIDGRVIKVAADTAPIRQYSPTGGNSLVVGNLEWRAPAPFLSDVVQVATFVDAGLVWNRPRESVTWSDLRVTPGVGIRVNSPVGPFRMDVAYNRYRSVAGAAYIVNRTTKQLECVLLRRGGTIADGGGGSGAEQCPATFVPAQQHTFLSRLTFNFSIGQAF